MKILEKLIPTVEIANLSYRSTGLSNRNLAIYTSTKLPSHKPRVKVFEVGKIGRNKPNIVFSISRDPQILKDNGLQLSSEDIQEVKRFIRKNYIILLQFWYSDYENVIMNEYIYSLEPI